MMGTTDIGNKEIDLLLRELDAGSRRMLLYLMKHKHAKLDELTEVLGESCHMNTLVRIKNVINPKALVILKRPVLLFEKSRVERENGENVLFSWWLTEEDERKVLLKEEEQFADVFDEDNEVLIIMDLRGVREESIQVKVDPGSATILFRDSNGIEHARQTPLPADVKIAEFRKQFQNQTLIISIPKK